MKTRILTYVWSIIGGYDIMLDISHYWDTNKESIDTEVHYADICADPMNGCPGDFAEDGANKMRAIDAQLWEIKLHSWIQSILDYFLHRYEKRAWESHYKLLAIWYGGPSNK
jgi:hypothetical protein